MPTQRFVDLMMKGLYANFDEMWISEQPYLLFTYVSVYTPWIGRQINKFVGPKRVQALTSGENIFNMKVSFNQSIFIYLFYFFDFDENNIRIIYRHYLHDNCLIV